MMSKEVQAKVEAGIKTKGAASSRIAELRKRVEERCMKVEEGLVDELFEGTSDFEEAGMETDDEGFEENSSGEEYGRGGDGRGSATKPRGRQNQGGRKRNADAVGITTPESQEKSVAAGTCALPNGVFDDNDKRKANKSQLKSTLVK